MIMVAVFIICLALGVPIMATIGMATIVPIFVDGIIPMTMVVQTLYTGVDQFPLIAVTGFILAGALMGTGGITERIIEVAASLVGGFAGGLATVTIVACMFFAAISGSGPATVAAIGGIMLPGMFKRGYDRDFGAAVAASGGALGILIPPSNPMIIFGVVASVSITQLFMAGLIPGLLIGVMMIGAGQLVSYKRKYVGSGEPFSARRVMAAVRRGKWALLAPVIILGGIYAGVFTPVEAAAVAVFYAFFVGVFVYRSLTWPGFLESLRVTAMTSGTVIVIVGIALSFGRLLTIYQIPQMVAEGLSAVSSDPIIVLFLIAIFLIVIGTFMETLAQIIILTPVFLPLVKSLGVDPIHFGVIFVVCCEIGFLTPPLGANLYVAMKQADVSLEAVSKAVLPFLAALIVGLVPIILFPSLSLFLPQLLMGN
ncbi:MAG: TRAP transporter large permease [Rhodospirillales bacterium]|jgi:C4-dicarboxylate transporter, DctM subunit|nr:TRAP transporter large permease [Rhodospirillales bacterium]